MSTRRDLEQTVLAATFLLVVCLVLVTNAVRDTEEAPTTVVAHATR